MSTAPRKPAQKSPTKPLTKNQRKKLKKKLKKQQEKEREKEEETCQNVPEMEVNGDKSPTSPSAECGIPAVSPGNSDPANTGENVPVVVNGGRGTSEETRASGGNGRG